MKAKSCAAATTFSRRDLALGDQHRLFLAGVLARLAQPVDVFLLVAEPERVGQRLRHRHLEKTPPSNSAPNRSRGPIGMWWPQLVQTCSDASSSRWNSIVPQSSHLTHRFSGISRRENSELIFGRT